MAPASDVPTRIETTQPPSSPPHGERVSAPAGFPVPNPAPPPTLSVVPSQEPGKDLATPAPVDDAESDRHAPVLQYLRFDPPEIQDGGVAMLSVGATDDLSGVKFVYGTVRSPSEAAVVPFNAQALAGTDAFTARIAIPHQAETGDWFVATLMIVDGAGNPQNLAFAKTSVPQGGSLRVTSGESDSTAPSVHRVVVDKGTVGAGEKNQILVTVDDDRSGVASVTGTFQSPSKSAYIPFACRPTGDPSTWEGDISVPASADCGEWTLAQLRVADKASNTAYLSGNSAEVGRVSFVVSGGGACDSDPPFVDTLYFSPTIVSNATASEITLTATAHDDSSGVITLSGWIEGPVSANGQVPRIYFACQADPKDPEAPMTAKIPVPQYAATGTWRVTLVQVTDKARNTRNYSKDEQPLKGATFTVE